MLIKNILVGLRRGIFPKGVKGNVPIDPEWNRFRKMFKEQFNGLGKMGIGLPVMTL